MFRIVAVFFSVFIAVVSSPAQTTAVHAQSPAGATANAAAENAPEAVVPLSDAVITVPGICDHQAAAGPCATVITREQFENLLNGLTASGQPLRADQRKALAEAYVNFVAYAAAARKEGIEGSPQFREFMMYQQLRILAGMYKHVLEEKYKTPAPEDIKAYYDRHRADFEEVNVRRLMVPKNNPGAKDQEGYKRKAVQLAQDMQVRAAKGEDLEDLQKEAYQSLGLSISPPAAEIGRRRRASFLPEEAEEIFSLRPGDASKLETEISSYVVYRVESKKTLPVDQVKNEIAQLLFKERMNGAIKAITEDLHPQLNPKYFGDSKQPSQTVTPSQALSAH